MIEKNRRFFPNFQSHKVWELGLSLLVGILFGALVVSSPYLPVPSEWQKLVFVIPIAFALVMVFKNLEKLILAAIAIGVVLNLDFSVIISPYAANNANIAIGNRTIIALTELRVSFILIIVVVGYLLWLVGRQGANRQPLRFFTSTSVPALGLIFFSIVSVFQAQDVQLSFFKIAQLIELFLMYFYLANHLRTQQDLKFFVTVLMGGMLAESILMIVQWLTGWSFSFAGISANVGGDLRTTGTLGTANSAGVIVSAYLAIVCSMFWLFPRRSQKVFAGICFVIGCIALISTAGRAAWGGFIVAILGFIFIGWRRGWVQRRALVWLFLLTLVIGAIFYPAIYNRLKADDRGSAASRPLMFRLAWNVISASPLNLFLGVGANNYALIAPRYNTVVGDYLGNLIEDTSVHDVYLLTWAETGLFGLLFFLGFLAASLVKTWKHIQSGSRFGSLMALGLGCAIIVMGIQMFVDPYIARPKTIFLWLLVSLIASLDNFESKEVSSLLSRQSG